MALALLVFPEPNDESGSARMLLRQIETDHKALVRFKDAFNSDSSPNATEFEYVKGQLAALQRHLRDLSMRYHRYPRQTYKRVLQDNALKRLWLDLCGSVDRLSKQLDRTKKNNYSCFEIWRKLDDIKIIYEDIERELKPIVDDEDRLRRMRRG